ncbi:hypothetical protein ZWY2020_044610 [Hordeum vulgare]|nr:hypothetical protein ZWY2020_044610 [Hordeum vulgare]
MVDEDTNECSLVSLPAPTVIALPPLPEDAPEPYLWFGCALSVQTTPPDCTVVLDFVRERCLEWLLAPPEGIKRFEEEMRPVKLTTKVLGYAPAKNDFLFKRVHTIPVL